VVAAHLWRPAFTPRGRFRLALRLEWTGTRRPTRRIIQCAERMGHHAVTIRRHFHLRHRRDTLHLRHAFRQHYGTLDKSRHALQDRHFRLPTPLTASASRKVRVSWMRPRFRHK
jgi:hypothetical protein